MGSMRHADVDDVVALDVIDLATAGVIDAGDAWFGLFGSGDGETSEGQVLASSGRAVYVETGGTVLALVSASAPPGPIHLRVDTVPYPTPGSRVRLHGQPRVSARWRPPSLDAELLRRHADAARRSLTETAASGLAGHPAVAVAEWAVGRGDLPAAVGALAGLGPGLTPSGDDVLAGLLVVLAVAGHDGRELRRAVDGAPTHAISRAFLTWAARGQAVEPVHRLLDALAASDPAAVRRHQEAVLALGHTSGADLLLGLRVGLGALVSRPAPTS
jgi:Protein of unknown function (DUF2877)